MITYDENHDSQLVCKACWVFWDIAVSSIQLLGVMDLAVVCNVWDGHCVCNGLKLKWIKTTYVELQFVVDLAVQQEVLTNAVNIISDHQPKDRCMNEKLKQIKLFFGMWH
jgi:hypothetical protein